MNLLAESNFDLYQSLNPRQIKRFDKALSQHLNLSTEHIRFLPPLFAQGFIQTQMLGNGGQSMDAQLWSFAKSKSKDIDFLESAETQKKIYENVDEDELLLQLKSTMSNLTKAKKVNKKLLDAYVDQDIHGLYKMGRKSLGKMRQSMINNRNPAMVNRILDWMTNPHAYFISVGAAHLSGQFGLLHLLRQNGIIIEPMLAVPSV